MDCLRCGSAATTERPERTARATAGSAARGLRPPVQRAQRRPVNRAQHPADVVALVALRRLRCRRTLQDLSGMFLLRGIVFSHEAVRDWEASARWRRKGTASRCPQAARGRLRPAAAPDPV